MKGSTGNGSGGGRGMVDLGSELLMPSNLWPAKLIY